MIDIENEVNNIVYNAVIGTYPNAKFDSVLNLTPSEFPCVCVEEVANVVRSSSVDSGSNERHATVTYEINVFTNKTSGKKQQAKDIIAKIDSALLAVGFERTSTSPFTLDNGTLYRMVIRYSATVSENHTLYRR